MALKTSNENILFLYLQIKKDIINLDRKLKELDVFVEGKKKEVEKALGGGTTDSSDPRVQLFMKLVSTMGNMDAQGLDVKGMILQEIDVFESNTRTVLTNNLSWRASVLRDMQTAFDVLKEEMADEVERIEEIIKNSEV